MTTSLEPSPKLYKALRFGVSALQQMWSSFWFSETFLSDSHCNAVFLFSRKFPLQNVQPDFPRFSFSEVQPDRCRASKKVAGSLAMRLGLPGPVFAAPSSGQRMGLSQWIPMNYKTKEKQMKKPKTCFCCLFFEKRKR